MRASWGVTPSGKHVWQVISELDVPYGKSGDGIGGCYMTSRRMAEELALDEDSVLELRADLLKYGLLHEEPVPGLKGSYWFLRFPTRVESRLPQHIKDLPPRSRSAAVWEWIAAQALALDDHIGALKGRNIRAPSPRSQRQPPLVDITTQPSRQGNGEPQRVGELLNTIPGVADALAKASRPDDPPLPDEPPVEDEEPAEPETDIEDVA